MKQDNQKAIDAARQAPRFNLKERYNNLNLAQKHILQKHYSTSFKKSSRALYYTLERNNLTDEELFYFAAIFDCRVLDLYTEPPKQGPSIYELQRKIKGVKPGFQANLEI